LHKTRKNGMEHLTLTNNNEFIRFSADEIAFIKGDGNYSNIFLTNGKKENMTCQLHDLMDRLSKLNYCPFHRVGKSIIVNKDYIFKVNPGLQKLILGGANLCDDIHVKASKDALKELKEQLEKEGGSV